MTRLCVLPGMQVQEIMVRERKWKHIHIHQVMLYFGVQDVEIFYIIQVNVLKVDVTRMKIGKEEDKVEDMVEVVDMEDQHMDDEVQMHVVQDVGPVVVDSNQVNKDMVDKHSHFI